MNKEFEKYLDYSSNMDAESYEDAIVFMLWRIGNSLDKISKNIKSLEESNV